MSNGLDDLAVKHLACPYCGATVGARCRTLRTDAPARTHEDRQRPFYAAYMVGREAGAWSQAATMAYQIERAGYDALGRWARKVEAELYPEWLR